MPLSASEMLATTNTLAAVAQASRKQQLETASSLAALSRLSSPALTNTLAAVAQASRKQQLETASSLAALSRLSSRVLTNTLAAVAQGLCRPNPPAGNSAGSADELSDSAEFVRFDDDVMELVTPEAAEAADRIWQAWERCTPVERAAALVAAWIVVTVAIHCVRAGIDPEILFSPSARIGDSLDAVSDSVFAAIAAAVVATRTR